MKLGIFGATVYNHNLGCQALSWSFLTFMENVATQMNTTFEYIIFDRSIKEDSIKKMCELCRVDRNRIKVILGSTPKLYKISQNKNFIDSVKECDCIIDITQGDNFSDIYGKKRFYTWTIEKRIVQKLRVPLILGPQTYGPFIDEKCKKFAAKVINVIGAKRISIRKKIQMICQQNGSPRAKMIDEIIRLYGQDMKKEMLSKYKTFASYPKSIKAKNYFFKQSTENVFSTRELQKAKLRILFGSL